MKTAVRFAALLFLLACATAPVVPVNSYGLRVVPDFETYQQQVRADRDNELIDLEKFIPAIVIDVRYATDDNFMHQRLYPVAKVFLRRPAAIALRDVQHDLAAQGLGLKVFDGYRPYGITERMWEPIRNSDYVADPAKGSRHNRGAAVDLTLIDLRTRNDLLMPTPYDDFSPRARQDYAVLPAQAIINRQRLRDVMTRHGFDVMPSEWWHFDYHGWNRFDLMDVPLERLLPV